MKISTKPRVLKKAWKILKDMGLEQLISGRVEKSDDDSVSVTIQFVNIIDELLEKDRLNEFCQIITQSELDFNDMEFPDIMDVISDFFSTIGGSFGRLGLPMKMMKS